MISKEIENIIGAVPAFRKVALLFRVDPGEIDVSADKLDEVLAKAIWFVIPFHVFLISRIYHGDITLMFFWSIVSILVVLVYGNVIALFDARAGSGYETKARQWSIVCVLLWATTLITIAAGYLVAWLLGEGGLELFTGLAKITIGGGYRFPASGWFTLVVSIVYSTIALLLLQFIVGRRQIAIPNEQDALNADAAASTTSASRGLRKSAMFFVILVTLNALVLFLSTVIFEKPAA